MIIVVIIGLIYMLVEGNLFECLLFLGIVAIVNDKFTDSNRRGGWWK